MHYCEVAVKYAASQAYLTYSYDDELELLPGDLVKIPLRNRMAEGCVVRSKLTLDDLDASLREVKFKSVEKAEDGTFSLSAQELELYKWIANYYHYNLGMVIFESLPKILKRPRKVDLLHGEGLDFEHEPNPEQKYAYESIAASASKGFGKYLIHGVTGSGKTLIYLHLIRDVISRGKSVLFLLPEINLTPQFTKTFLKFLDCPILSYHSGISASEKFTIWKYLKESGDRPVVVMGVRSSVFLPINNLGLVIVDEEHDQSFKQSDRLPYNGRDIAIKKAQLADVPVILGSATPSVENYYNFSKEEGSYYPLKSRASGEFPEVSLINLKEEKQNDPDYLMWPMSHSSFLAIEEALAKKEQVLIFINRLGYADYLQCRGCGHQFTDPNTDLPLRYFKSKNILASSHSDYQIPAPEICPECGNMNLLQKGFGTEKIAELIRERIPAANVDRFDRDEIKNFKDLNEKLNQFESGKIDILVGTQMLSKGHNFKKVNTVLILGVDSLLNFPDFRALERAYQLITQITGRAGRFGKEAKVFIQTLNPENKIFSYIQNHHFEEFYHDEIDARKFCNFPPFSKIVAFHFTGRFRERLVPHIQGVVSSFQEIISKNHLEISILGPTPRAIEKKANQFTWTFLLKSQNVAQIHSLIHHFKQHYQEVSGVSYKIDVDPYQIL